MPASMTLEHAMKDARRSSGASACSTAFSGVTYMPANAARMTKSISTRQPVTPEKNIARSINAAPSAGGVGVAKYSSIAMKARPSAPIGGRPTPTLPPDRASDATAPIATPIENPARRTVKTPSSTPRDSLA